MDKLFEPILTTTDWNEEWKRLQAARGHADDASFWDERAKTFPVKHGKQTDYVQKFLQLADVKPNETVLDMGCGTGSVATPLARMGCHVVACDFSQGMLDKMQQDLAELGIADVEVHKMSWADDWAAHGFEPKCVDVALASRSIATDDMRAALLKLDRVARRRACITLAGGPTPRIDMRLLADLGFGDALGRDFLYAFNILASCGICPEVAYIDSRRTDVFASLDEARTTFAKIVRDALRGRVAQHEMDSVPERLEPWLEEHLVKADDGSYLSQDYVVTWAFIAWTPANRG